MFVIKRVGDEVGFVENCICLNNYIELLCGFCSLGKVDRYLINGYICNFEFFGLLCGI